MSHSPEPWQFIWNAKDHELGESATDLEQYRLPAEELKRLGEQVTKLRELQSRRSAAIQTIGHTECMEVCDHDEHEQHRHICAQYERRKLLAKEEIKQESVERDFNSRYKRRRYCDLSVTELTGIKHAVHIQHRFYRDIAEEYRVSIGLVSRVA